jgi:hypothetical protein
MEPPITLYYPLISINIGQHVQMSAQVYDMSEMVSILSLVNLPQQGIISSLKPVL